MPATWWRASGRRGCSAPARWRLYRTLTDEIGARLTGSPAHMQAARWARRPLHGMGPRQPAPRAVRVRPRLAARTRVGGDDRTALHAAHRLRRRVVSVDRGRGERTRRSTSATRPPRRSRPWPASFAAPSCSRIFRRREFVDRDRPQPGLDDRPVATGNPALPQAAKHDAGQRADAAAQRSGRGRGAAAERVPRWHRRRDRESRHALRRGAVDRRRRRAVQRARASGRAGTSGRRCAWSCGRATSRRTATATTSSPRSRDRIRRCAIRSCSSARTSTRGTRRAAPPTTPMASSPSWRRCASSARSAPRRGAPSGWRCGAARSRGCSAPAPTSRSTSTRRPHAISWPSI